MLRIKLVKSPIGNVPRNRATVAALGLRKINQVVEHSDSPMIRGMIHKIKHMVVVEEAEGSPKSNLANARRSTATVKEKPAKPERTPKPKAERPAAAAKPKAEKSVKAEKAPAAKAKPKTTTKKSTTKEEK
jgi:large subunit ribosomal protein L30